MKEMKSEYTSIIRKRVEFLRKEAVYWDGFADGMEKMVFDKEFRKRVEDGKCTLRNIPEFGYKAPVEKCVMETVNVDNEKPKEEHKKRKKKRKSPDLSFVKRRRRKNRKKYDGDYIAEGSIFSVSAQKEALRLRRERKSYAYITQKTGIPGGCLVYLYKMNNLMGIYAGRKRNKGVIIEAGLPKPMKVKKEKYKKKRREYKKWKPSEIARGVVLRKEGNSWLECVDKTGVPAQILRYHANKMAVEKGERSKGGELNG